MVNGTMKWYELVPPQYDKLGLEGPDVIRLLPLNLPSSGLGQIAQAYLWPAGSQPPTNEELLRELDLGERAVAVLEREFAGVKIGIERNAAGIERNAAGITTVQAEIERLKAVVEKLEESTKEIRTDQEELSEACEKISAGYGCLIIEKIQGIFCHVVSAGSRFKSYACLSSGKDWVKVAGLCAIVAVSALFFAGLAKRSRAI